MRTRLMALGAVATLIATLAACSDVSGPPDQATAGQAGGSTIETSSTSNKTIIALVGSAAFPAAKGKAVFDSRPDRRELEIEAENLKRLAQTTVNFSLDGANIGSARVSALGRVSLSLSTQLGDQVPTSVTGKAVAVRTQDGRLVVSGSF